MTVITRGRVGGTGEGIRSSMAMRRNQDTSLNALIMSGLVLIHGNDLHSGR